MKWKNFSAPKFVVLLHLIQIGQWTSAKLAGQMHVLTGPATWAAGAVAASCVQRIAKVHDQYLSFVALEAGLFSLGLPSSYLELNDPAAGESQIEVKALPHK